MLDHFDIVSLNLQLIGAVSVEEYLNNSNYEKLPVNYDLNLNFHASEDLVRKTTARGGRSLDVQDGSVSFTDNERPQKDHSEADDSLEILTSKCSASFPDNVVENILKWQFEEDSILILGNAHKTWRAKLTIMKPTGESMSIHSSQSMEIATAQVDAAKKAIKSGALDFMSPSDDQTSQLTLPVPPLQEKAHSVEPLRTQSAHHNVFTKPLEGADPKKQGSKEHYQGKGREKCAVASVMDSEPGGGATHSILPHAPFQGVRNVPPTTPALSPGAAPPPPSVIPPTIFQAPALPNPPSQFSTCAETKSAIQQVESIFAANKRQDSILRWYQHTEKSQEKSEGKCGFALLVKLSNTLHHVYSTPSTFSHAEFAKEQCAEIALKEGFPEFVQSQPSTQLPYATVIDDLDNIIDLQQFYASLGNSFREAWGNKSVHELGALQWLNTAVVGVRGSQLVCSFHIIRRNRNGDALAGALLRLERPNDHETISYLIEPRFRREKDARIAVCLHAMALGVGDYLKKLESEMYSRSPTQRMKLFSKKVSKMIPEHLKKIVLTVERGAWGGTLSLTSNLPSNLGGTQEYKVPHEYRNKPDAEAALLCLAVQKGCMEFLLFGNCSSPAEYSPALAHEASEILEEHKTRVTERGRGEVEPGEVVSGGSIPDGTQAKTPIPVNGNTHTPLSSRPGTNRSAGGSSSSSASMSMSIPSVSQGSSTATPQSPFPFPPRANNAIVPPFSPLPHTFPEFPPRRQLATRGGGPPTHRRTFQAAATTVPVATFDSAFTTLGPVQPLNHVQTQERMLRSNVERSRDTRKRPIGSDGLDALNSTGTKRRKG